MVQERFQCGQASALHGWTPVLAGPTDWRRCVEASIQPQSGDAGNGLGQRLAAVEPVHYGVTAIAHQYQGTVGQPAWFGRLTMSGIAGSSAGSNR